jgi:cytochrome bd-type quinol oxidase subunit 2
LGGFLALDVAGLLLGQLVVGAWVKVGAHIDLFVVFQVTRPFDRLRGRLILKQSAKIGNIWIGWEKCIRKLS